MVGGGLTWESAQMVLYWIGCSPDAAGFSAVSVTMARSSNIALVEFSVAKVRRSVNYQIRLQ
jgi:hypothetical protein